MERVKSLKLRHFTIKDHERSYGLLSSHNKYKQVAPLESARQYYVKKSSTVKPFRKCIQQKETSQFSLTKPRALAIIGFKEKIESRLSFAIRSPLLHNSRGILTERPCTPSPIPSVKYAIRQPNIKIPCNIEDSMSETESNIFMESRLPL